MPCRFNLNNCSWFEEMPNPCRLCKEGSEYREGAILLFGKAWEDHEDKLLSIVNVQKREDPEVKHAPIITLKERYARIFEDSIREQIPVKRGKTMKRVSIALLGGPGSGKTTLCADVFAEMKKMGINVEQVQEYAREKINKLKKDEGKTLYNVWQQYEVLSKQREKEDCIPGEVEYIITDSPTILSYIYTLLLANPLSDERQVLADMYKNFLDDLLRYTHFIILKRDSKHGLKDGTRSQTMSQAEWIDFLILKELQMHHVPHFFVSGSADEKKKEVLRIAGIIGKGVAEHKVRFPYSLSSGQKKTIEKMGMTWNKDKQYWQGIVCKDYLDKMRAKYF